MQLWRDDYGTVIAIGIESNDREEIICQYYSFWNHGATSGDLIWIGDTFAYFWTTPDNLEQALIERALFRLLNQLDTTLHKGKSGGLMPEAIKLAEIDYHNIKPQQFACNTSFKADDIPTYRMGYLEYETPDLKYY